MNNESSRKVLQLVRELHLRGYEQIRISPGMSASGMYWRCSITPASNIELNHGARIIDYGGPNAAYTSADEDKPFGWSDFANCTPAELADKFIESFTGISSAGLGRDTAYVKWYRDMLEATEPDSFLIAYADCDLPPDHLITVGAKPIEIPMPPLPENKIFEKSVKLIKREYDRLGHDLGWRFLYSPKATLGPRTEIVFIGLNPGGADDEGIQKSYEKGNAYFREPWNEEKLNSLQVQVCKFYDIVAGVWGGSRDKLMDESLALNLWPYRSRSFTVRDAQTTDANKFIDQLWTPILEHIRPKLLVTMGAFTTNQIHRLLPSSGTLKLKKHKTGWGEIIYQLGTVKIAGEETLLVALPHLSRFGIFRERVDFEPLKKKLRAFSG